MALGKGSVMFHRVDKGQVVKFKHQTEFMVSTQCSVVPGARAVARLARFLLWKREDLSSTPRAHIKSQER